MTTTTTTPTVTLEQINADPYIRIWDNTFELTNEIAVGRCGRSRRGTTGGKLHLLHLTRITKAINENNAKDVRMVGSLFWANGFCNGNGQVNATPIKGATLEMITCEKCKRSAEFLIAKHSQQ
jgi:hypothetical protein